MEGLLYRANIALDKPATASSFVLPYSPLRAVDGVYTAISRWLSNALPCWLTVDLGDIYLINRWVVTHMGAVGFATPGYNTRDFKLQGSSDNLQWTDIDAVTGNASDVTDRSFVPVCAQFVRVVVTKGLNINNSLAAIVELELYGVITSSNLSGLTVSCGLLSPTFSSINFLYTVNVQNGITITTVTPTSEYIDATITVNGTNVISGQASPQITLEVGNNVIAVKVTSVCSEHKIYTINVIRAEAVPQSRGICF